VLLDRTCTFVFSIGEFAVVWWRKRKWIVGRLRVTVICLEGVADAVCARDVVHGYSRLRWVGRVRLDLLVFYIVDRVRCG
jgi:hypothetical protein